jgi:hypothetical protein
LKFGFLLAPYFHFLDFLFSKYEINKYACPVWLELVLEQCRLKCAYMCVEFLLLLAACSALASGSGVDIWSGCAFLQIGTIALFSLKNCVLLRRAYKPLFHF